MSERMEVWFRFYGELNDFLARPRRGITFSHRVSPRQSLKDIIESLGVPHVEVCAIHRHDGPARFSDFPRPGDRFSVYPDFRDLDVAFPLRLQPPVTPPARFAVDVNLGRLVALLRLCGLDALRSGEQSDEQILNLATHQDRVLLTRDRRLLMRKALRRGYWVRSTDPRRQISEVVDRFGLRPFLRPFRRCLRCNGILRPVTKSEILPRLEPLTARYFDDFRRCPDCGRIYWKGSHFTRLSSLIEGLPP